MGRQSYYAQLHMAPRAHLHFFAFVTILILSASLDARAASFLEQLGLTKGANTAALSSLSQDQVISGLKEALAKGVQVAITNLGRPEGFLKDPKVKITLPESLRKVENGLRVVGQGALADEFVTTMNRAAELAVPEAVAVLSDSVKQMTVADAKGILTSTNSAATEYFRRTSSTNLQARFLPIVKTATAKAGVTAAYKRMVEKTNLGGFASIGGYSANKNALDVDSYVTSKTIDGLFVKIAEQEKLIRENPAARSTELLQKVFGTLDPKK